MMATIVDAAGVCFFTAVGLLTGVLDARMIGPVLSSVEAIREDTIGRTAGIGGRREKRVDRKRPISLVVPVPALSARP
jgi:hypothetical protein